MRLSGPAARSLVGLDGRRLGHSHHQAVQLLLQHDLRAQTRAASSSRDTSQRSLALSGRAADAAAEQQNLLDGAVLGRDVRVDDVALLRVGGRQLGDPLVGHHDVRLRGRGALAEERLGVEVGARGVEHAAAAHRVVLDEAHVVHLAGLAQRLAGAALDHVAVALVVHEHHVHPARPTRRTRPTRPPERERQRYYMARIPSAIFFTTGSHGGRHVHQDDVHGLVAHREPALDLQGAGGQDLGGHRGRHRGPRRGQAHHEARAPGRGEGGARKPHEPQGRAQAPHAPGAAQAQGQEGGQARGPGALEDGPAARGHGQGPPPRLPAAARGRGLPGLGPARHAVALRPAGGGGGRGAEVGDALRQAHRRALAQGGPPRGLGGRHRPHAHAARQRHHRRLPGGAPRCLPREARRAAGLLGRHERRLDIRATDKCAGLVAPLARPRDLHRIHLAAAAAAPFDGVPVQGPRRSFSSRVRRPGPLGYNASDLLPHEYFFLRHHVVYHLAQQDVAMLGETLRALRCFEGSSNLVQMRRGLAFLLLTQRDDGSWMSESTEADATQRYFSTIQALWALCEPHRVGFAPAFPEATPILELHLNAADIDMADDAPTEVSNSTSPVPHSSSDADPEVAAATAAAPSENEDVATRVAFLQGLLDQNGNVKNVSAALATHVLSTLADMILTVDILKSTGVGRTINKLRKHATPSVAKAATQLVAKWKKDLL
ncbi:hypothetical protein ON010_g192 [Phytophthora cinnamomi]|nr:hypothetical protein ON010_g192 [Phytophthora cinnamomi]